MSSLVVAGTFQEKIFARIKEGIGDLMTDEDLARLVEVAMKDAFFTSREVRSGYQTKTEPPILIGLVRELLQEKVDVAIKQWLADHPDEVTKIINDRLDAGVTQMIAGTMDRVLGGAFQVFGEQLRSALNLDLNPATFPTQYMSR